MKTKTLTCAIVLATLTFTLSTQAHDPKKHMKNAEKPNCSAMKEMDHSKIDMDDPVMQAMMKQCMKDIHHHDDDNGKEQSHENHKKERTNQESKHQH